MRERDLDAVHADGPVEVVRRVFELHQERHAACRDADAGVRRCAMEVCVCTCDHSEGGGARRGVEREQSCGRLA